MTPRIFARADAKFLETALSPQERTLELIRLRRYRTFHLWLTIPLFWLLIACTAIAIFTRDSGSTLMLLYFVFTFSIINLKELTARIWILEILQRTSSPPPETPPQPT